MNAVVVKIGGNELSKPHFVEQLSAAIVELAGSTKVVLVHGGGREIDRRLAALGIEPAYHQGQRITDEATLEVVESVLAGTVNGALVRALLGRGIRALGVSGNDLALLPVTRWEGLGRVGRVGLAAAEPLQALLGLCEVLVLAPLGLGAEDGMAYNVNADHAAAAVAAALGAPLVLVTDVPGVLSGGHLLPRLDAAAARGLIEAEVIHGGMVPKVEAAFSALERGASSVTVVNLEGLGHGGTQIVPTSSASRILGPKGGTADKSRCVGVEGPVGG